MRALSRAVLALATLVLSMTSVQAEEAIKPFVLAQRASGEVAGIVEQVKQKLTAAGFELAGEYRPYEGTAIVVVTNAALKQAAAKSEFGGYGAAQRVAVTKVGDEVQVSYTNPVYMANAYRMAEDLQGVADQMAKVLGNEQAFGPEQGLSPKQLRGYHYMFGMEYFDEPSELAEHKSFKAAVQAVEEKLATGVSGVTKIYRIDIPGKEEAVFGVGLRSAENKYQDDAFVMSEIDFKPLRSSAHLPYEMLVSGNKVYALYARFRIAINFPDLAMMGDNSFMNIMQTPVAIERALIKAAGGRIQEETWP